MNDGREIIIVFYKLFRVVCEFRYSKDHKIKKKASTIFIFYLFIYVGSIYIFLS